MDTSQPTRVVADVPADLWVSQPDTAAYLANKSVHDQNVAIDGMTLTAGAGVGIMIAVMLRKQLMSVAVSMFPIVGPFFKRFMTPAEEPTKVEPPK